jgi:hypothetical protein
MLDLRLDRYSSLNAEEGGQVVARNTGNTVYTISCRLHDTFEERLIVFPDTVYRY